MLHRKRLFRKKEIITDRQTDRRTDGRTDTSILSRYRGVESVIFFLISGEPSTLLIFLQAKRRKYNVYLPVSVLKI